MSIKLTRETMEKFINCLYKPLYQRWNRINDRRAKVTNVRSGICTECKLS